MNRRAFLAASAAGLLAGCGHKAQSPQPAGTLLGPSLELGHRLRDGSFPAPQSEANVPLIIVGGGIAGLSAAWRLQKAGFTDYLLLEMEPQVGGNSRWGENQVSRFPWGAHYLPIPGPEAVWVRELLAELGVLRGNPAAEKPEYEERYLCHSPQERLYINGTWQEGVLPQFGMDAATRKQYRQFETLMLAFKQHRGHDGRRAFVIPAALSSRDPALLALDRLSMRDWLLQQGLTAKPLHWFVNYACRDDYGTDYSQTSAWAGIHYYASRNGQAANAAGDAVLTWPEGNGWLVQALQKKLADRIRSDHMVYRMRQDDHQVQVDTWQNRTGKTLRLRAEQVIWASPAFLLPRVWPEAPAALQNATQQCSYAPWLVANLTLDALPQHRGHTSLAWDNVLYDSRALGYVVATHQDLRVREDATVLTYYRALTDRTPAAARQQLLNTRHADWAGQILQDLTKPHPEIRSLTRRIDIWRWGHAMIRPTPGFLWGTARHALELAQQRIRLAHSDVSGLSLFEEAQFRGVLAAEAALHELGVKTAP